MFHQRIPLYLRYFFTRKYHSFFHPPPLTSIEKGILQTKINRNLSLMKNWVINLVLCLWRLWSFWFSSWSFWRIWPYLERWPLRCRLQINRPFQLGRLPADLSEVHSLLSKYTNTICKLIQRDPHGGAHEWIKLRVIIQPCVNNVTWTQNRGIVAKCRYRLATT